MNKELTNACGFNINNNLYAKIKRFFGFGEVIYISGEECIVKKVKNNCALVIKLTTWFENFMGL